MPGKELTPAELRCMRALAEGHTAITAGKLLHLSSKTIKCEAMAARQKLGALNTTHAVAIMFREGLLHTGVYETPQFALEEDAV